MESEGITANEAARYNNRRTAPVRFSLVLGLCGTIEKKWPPVKVKPALIRQARGRQDHRMQLDSKINMETLDSLKVSAVSLLPKSWKSKTES
jgi:hypothetical protein